MSEELLKAGLAKYVAYSAAIRGPEWVTKLKAAEQYAFLLFSHIIINSDD